MEPFRLAQRRPRWCAGLAVTEPVDPLLCSGLPHTGSSIRCAASIGLRRGRGGRPRLRLTDAPSCGCGGREYVCALRSSARLVVVALPRRQHLLHRLGHRQCCIEVLVLNDRRLIYLPDLVKHPVGQDVFLVTYLEQAVRILADIDPLARQRSADIGRFKDDQRLVVMQRQRLRYRTLLAPDHLSLEILVRSKGAMHIARIERRLGESLVVARHIARQERVGLGNRRYAIEPHRLDQAVLQRPVGALDPALGLRRVGANDLDVERFQRPAEVGHAVALGRGRVVPEHAVLVRVDRHRLAMCLDISGHCIHVGEGVLALDHPEVHQLAGRIVDEHQQRALRSAILEPPVLRAIDLDQLATTIAAVARLIGPWPTSPSVSPPAP